MLDLIHPGAEPACWSWTVPAPRTAEEYLAAKLAEEADRPAEHQFGRRGLEMMLDGDPSNGRWGEFHDRRCAVCGIRPVDGHLIDDHCHATGQIRGLLCRSCNPREGASSLHIFVRYRRIHPAAILDYHVMYSGRGWEFGWSGPEVRRAYELGMRPATAWPTWNRDDPIGVKRR